MPLGTVAALWRYPVKSLRGESLERLTIGPLGVPGDRAFALRDRRDGRLLSGKRVADLLALAAAYPEGPGRAPVVTFPDGRRVPLDAPDAGAALSAALDRAIEIVRSDDASADRRVGAEGERTFTAPPFAFVDQAPLHLLTTASLRAIAPHSPASRFDVRRFRPNLLVDCGARVDFVEDGLAGRLLSVGERVRVRVVKPTARCALTTRAVEELPSDPAILRTVVERHGGRLGAYAVVDAGGDVRLGDDVVLLDG